MAICDIIDTSPPFKTPIQIGTSYCQTLLSVNISKEGPYMLGVTEVLCRTQAS